MSTNVPISLEDAKQLVELLEKGDNEGANALLEAISLKDSMELFSEVGKLTRQLHDSLNSFQLDSRISNLATEDIPDAQSRLNYVIETTEQAANTTMDAVETSMPIAEKLLDNIQAIQPDWQKLMSRNIDLSEFKNLCHKVDGMLNTTSEDAEQLNKLLTEVLMAQGYQDLTGQVIRRVIDLVKEVEHSLVNMLTVFGMPDVVESGQEITINNKDNEDIVAEGPVIDAEGRDDVVSGQDDVDDLLSSLGF